MDQFGPQQIGKLVLIVGIVLSLIGAVIILLGHLGLFKLPGDLEFSGKNWKVYIPIASCIIISIILTLILWLVSYFSRSR
jgi:ABC-type antimicrobial peptide transport system permease subunit